MLALFVALAVFAGCSSSHPRISAPTSSTPKPPQARIDGLYHLVSDKTMKNNGVAQPDSQPFDEQWAFRSGCFDGGCTAAARKVTDANDQPPQTFDFVDGYWTTTVERANGSNCAPNGPEINTALWMMWSLQAQSDGTLVGTITNIAVDACQYFDEYQVTLNRVGDAPANANLPDPAASPPLSPSVAQGFRGEYSETDTVRGSQSTGTAAYHVTTDCLRSGDRCVSYAIGDPVPDGGGVLLFASYTFADSKWSTSGVSVTTQCGTGIRNVTFYLPATPVPNPITTLTGEGQIDYTGDKCPAQVLQDYQLRRTGD
jgi:hypothetical protein